MRRHLIRLFEPFLNNGKKWNLAALKLDSDPDPQVRLQLACTLGEWNDFTQAGSMLGNLVLGEGEDPYFLGAVFSSIKKDNFAPFVSQVFGRIRQGSARMAVMDNLLKLGTRWATTKAWS